MDRNMPKRIPGPAGVVQAALQRSRYDRTSPIVRQDFSSTQEYVTKTIEHVERCAVEDDEDFKSALWTSALTFAGNDPPNTTLGAIGRAGCNPPTQRLAQVVAVIKSVDPNGLGDTRVTLKDPTGTVGGNIHKKVFNDEEWKKKIRVGAVLILREVTLFSSNPQAHYLNITLPNVVKVFAKDEPNKDRRKKIIGESSRSREANAASRTFTTPPVWTDDQINELLQDM